MFEVPGETLRGASGEGGVEDSLAVKSSPVIPHLLFNILGLRDKRHAGEKPSGSRLEE